MCFLNNTIGINMTRKSNPLKNSIHNFTRRYKLAINAHSDPAPFEVVFTCVHTIAYPAIREAFNCRVTIIHKGPAFLGSTTTTKTTAIDVRFGIGDLENFHINDFLIPEDLRNMGLGSFILKQIYDLTPESIKMGKFMISGNLPNGQDNTISRNSLWIKSVGHSNVFFDVTNDGYFKGRFLDPGNNWERKITIYDCVTEN